jgi:serine phosphatase RsbU (regulator of sigma subunit)/anti-sigma regulatory factor (Ser/Thr protein kinase)
MSSKDLGAAPKGSWRWTLHIAELTAWGTAAVLALVLIGAGLDAPDFRLGLALLAIFAVWNLLLFRRLLEAARGAAWLGFVALIGSLLIAAAGYAVLRDYVPSAQLVLLPVVVIMGLLTSVREGLAAGLLAACAYVGVAIATAPTPRAIAIAVNLGIFVLSGVIAGLLAAELRTHYRAEREEHRLATAVRHRLMAVVDAIDEAIVYRDRQGIARVVNERAGELFLIDPDDYLGLPVVNLLRRVARQTEDPEGFMETFQALRDEPEKEFRVWVEQIIPKRRQLRLFSGPTLDEKGALIGRIDVYTDVTEGMKRAAEIEDLYEQARRTAESYQRSLLPETPTLPLVNLVGHYIPAAGRRAVCGDFYDFITLPDSRMAVVLGDVCGIGPPAAADAALARYTLRSFTADETDLAALMERMNTHLLNHMSAERFVRLFIGAVDPERSVFEYVSAGHVPPVVFRNRSGEVDWLAEGAMALGIEEDGTFKVARIELAPQDVLVLYTDGLTESLRNGRPFGQGRLSDVIEAFGPGTPGEIVQAIRRSVESWTAGEELRDDLALIVAKIVPESLEYEPARELVLPNEPARMSELRAFVSNFMTDVHAPIEISHEFLLAVGEATGNAARHGRRREGRSEVRVSCTLEGRRLVVAVADDGSGFDVSAFGTDLPDRFASGGRGLFLMTKLSDSLDVQSTDEGTTVTMTRELGPAMV